ncbi:MAG TPA: formate dehydrogenase accessory sulfurtransferase FdhD [Steroidobacteraceae bacterium]|nr:formate dehydrogenase accessory sulfurtransferase FdhD [Steroidobacteraceae bacterium]
MSAASGTAGLIPGDEAVRTLQVRRWRAGDWKDVQDSVAAEVPVALSFNSIPHVVMLATPRDLEDLGVGFTVSEELVGDYSEVRDVMLDTSSGAYEVRISIDGTRLGALLERRRNLTGRTGCGVCGAETVEDAIRRPPPVAAGGEAPREGIVAALRRLRELQPLGALAGSLHAAAWVSWSGEVQLVREDVGRHNALDKLIGVKLRRNEDFADGYVLVTSRASYEMVQKTATLGIRMLVAVSAPTALGVELARECGVTLVGFAREEQQVVYSHPQRLR